MPELELSVIIPARDAASTLSAQLDALAAQDWEGQWEVIVVDDRSSDDTAVLARAHAGLRGRLRVVSTSEGSGIAHARNVGATVAAGRSLVFCDADDIVTEGWLAATADAMTEAQLATGPLLVRDLNPGPLGDSRGTRVEREAPSFYGVFPYAHGCNLAVRRALWEELGGFDEAWLASSEDIEFALRASLRGHRVRFVPAAAVSYRYRTEARDLTRQGFAYGLGRTKVARAARDQGLDVPRFPGWRSWGWLLVRLPTVVLSGQHRARWAWVAANRVGQLVGCVRFRVLCL